MCLSVYARVTESAVCPETVGHLFFKPFKNCSDSIGDRSDVLYTSASCTAVCGVLSSFVPKCNGSASLVCTEFLTCHRHQHGARLSALTSAQGSVFGSFDFAASLSTVCFSGHNFAQPQLDI